MQPGAPPLTLQGITLEGGRVDVRGATLTLESCALQGGHSLADGGAVWVRDGGRLEAHQTSFRQNAADRSGGAIALDGSHAVLDGCLIEGNTAVESGGGVDAQNSSLILGAGTLIRANVVSLNGEGNSIFSAGSSVEYQLPAPLGRYIDPTPDAYAGVIDKDVPLACAPGLFASSNAPEVQTGPQCEGTYSASEGSATCSLCQAGKFTSMFNSTACEDCTPGYLCLEGSSAPQPCPGGTHANQTVLNITGFLSSLKDDCIICPEGTSCPVGSAEPNACLPGSFGASAKKESCELCPAGKFTSNASNTFCFECTPGYLCIQGSAAPQPCPGGTHANQTVLNLTGFLSSLEEECIICPAGTACSVGSNKPMECLPGSFGAAPKQETCELCPEGKYTSTLGNTVCNDCTPGYLCIKGSSAPQPCPGGTHANQTILNLTGFLSDLDQCIVCPEGTSCSVGSAMPKDCLPGSFGAAPAQESCELCPEGKFTSTLGNTACNDCTPGYLCIKGSSAPIPCRGGTHANQTVLNITGFLSDLDQCIVCPEGTSCSVGTATPKPCLPGSYAPFPETESCPLCGAGQYQDLPGQTGCNPCTRGFYCEVGTAKPIPCPAGTFSNASALPTSANCTAVPPGYWAPLGSRLPEPCPSSGFYCPGADADTVNDPPGSKPIISPVGGVSTDAVTTELTLDMDPADFAANEEAMKLQLAELYGVDPSMLELAPSAGSLVLIVTITPPSTGGGGGVGGGMAFDAATITSQVDAVSVASLSQTLGVNISQVSSPQLTVVSAVCPRGYWCTAGEQVACLHGFYNPHPGANNQTSCKECPARATTIGEASTSPLSCVCTAGFYKLEGSDEGGGGGGSMMRCEPCESTWHLSGGGGTTCDQIGATLEALPLSPGFWRQSNASRTTRACFTPAACLGGGNASLQCATTQLEGSPYCAVCASDHHGGGDGSLCQPCEGSGVLTFLPSILLASGLLLTLAYMCLRRRGGREDRVSSGAVMRRARSLYAMLADLTERFSVKLRILISLVQVLKGISVSFAIPYPDFYRKLLQILSLIELNLPAAMPLGCFFPVQYYHRLAIMTAVPLVALLALAWLTRRFRHSRSRQWVSDLSNSALALLLFILYPSISTSLFSYFICDTLDGVGEDGTRFLRVDYSITCGSAGYTTFMPYTILMMLIFPFGTPMLYVALMLMRRAQLSRIRRAETRTEARHNIVEASRLTSISAVAAAAASRFTAVGDKGKMTIEQKEEEEALRAAELRSELTGVLRKITEGYKMSCYWFEVFECVRKLLIVGLPVFMPPGSNGQLFTGLVVSFLTMAAFAKFEPYEDPLDGQLQLVCQFEIFVALLSSLVLRMDPHNPILAVFLPAMLLLPPLFALLATCGVARRHREATRRRERADGKEPSWADIDPAPLPAPRPSQVSAAAKLDRMSRAEKKQSSAASAAASSKVRVGRMGWKNAAHAARWSGSAGHATAEAPTAASPAHVGAPRTSDALPGVRAAVRRRSVETARQQPTARRDPSASASESRQSHLDDNFSAYSCEKPISRRRKLSVMPGGGQQHAPPRPSSAIARPADRKLSVVVEQARQDGGDDAAGGATKGRGSSWERPITVRAQTASAERKFSRAPITRRRSVETAEPTVEPVVVIEADEAAREGGEPRLSCRDAGARRSPASIHV